MTEKFCNKEIKMKKLLLVLLLLLCSCEKRVATPKKNPQSKKNTHSFFLTLDLPQPTFEGTPENLPMKLKKPVREKISISPHISIISLGCKVNSSDSEPFIGELECITDGDKEGRDGSFVELGPGQQWVQIDLGKIRDIKAIALWHNFITGRVYYDVIIQGSNDGDFIDRETIFNNDHDNSLGLGVGKDDYYLEDYKGKLIRVDRKYRYIRCYSNGNTSDDLNHYTEIEIWGK